MAQTLAALRLAYVFLSDAFLVAPGSAWVQTMTEERLFEDFPLEPAHNAALNRGLESLRAAADRAKRIGYEEAAARLRRDHAALFVGPGHLPAPPWESVYRSREHLLFGDETVDVRSWYRRYGLRAKNLNREPDDHIGLELAFLAHLTALTIDAEAAGGHGSAADLHRAQGRFLREHIATWTPEFLQDVAEHAATEYFLGVSHLAEGVIKEALERVETAQG